MARIVKPFQWLRPPCSSLVQTHLNSNCKSHVSDSLFCFSLWATRQRTDYTTALPISQDTLQSSNAASLVKLHASFLVAQDVHPTAQGSQRKPSSAKQYQNHLVRKFHHYHVKLSHVRHRQAKTIAFLHNHNWHSGVSTRSHPSREIQHGIAAPSQKGKTCIQTIFTQSLVSMTTTSEYLPVSGFTLPSLHLSQSSRLHPFQVSQKPNCNDPSNKSHTWPACDTN